MELCTKDFSLQMIKQHFTDSITTPSIVALGCLKKIYIKRVVEQDSFKFLT